MGRATRNHSVSGVALLLAAAITAFGATQSWATGAATVPWGRFAGVAAHGSPGFDFLLMPGGHYGDVRPLLLGGAAALAVLALLLFVTRVPGLGVLWRLIALVTAALLGFAAVSAWTVVNDPSTVVATTTDSSFGQALGIGVSLAKSFGLLELQPGIGLWLLTIGTGLAAIAALIPAGRGWSMATPGPAPRAFQPPGGATLSAGWYQDQLDGRFLRYFDGMRWTDAIRPRD
jgi:hypothetical protein